MINHVKLKSELALRDIPQWQLATILGVNPSTLSDYLRGARPAPTGLGERIEALKYAAAPVVLSEIPRAGQAASQRQLQHAEQLLRFFVAIHSRHRVETYGAAKVEAVEPDLVTDVPPEPDECPCCHGELRCVLFGYDEGKGYRWYFAKAGTA